MTNPDEITLSVQKALTEAHPEPLTLDQLAETVGVTWGELTDALAHLDSEGVATPSSRDASTAVWMLHGAARTTAYAVWQTRPHDPVAGDADADPARCTRCGLTTGDQIHTQEDT